jgi:uncharacterized protein
VGTIFSLGEFHEFRGAQSRFIYLVPSGGIFELDDLSGAILDRFRAGGASSGQVVSDLLPRGFAARDIAGTVEELFQVRALRDEKASKISSRSHPKISRCKPW